MDSNKVVLHKSYYKRVENKGFLVLFFQIPSKINVEFFQIMTKSPGEIYQSMAKDIQFKKDALEAVRKIQKQRPTAEVGRSQTSASDDC